MALDYAQSGVNIDAGNESVDRIKNVVKQTFDSNVLTDVGSFGAMVSVDFLKQFRHPVIVQSTDSVGTKVKIASALGKYDTIGADIVAHSCNDIVVQGARPLTFLDYIAVDRVVPEQIEQMVRGVARGCKDAGMSLVGGEVAELPGVYASGEFDLVGSITGVVERDQVVDGSSIVPGDVVMGFASSGLHTNGYSLARKLFFELGGLSASDHLPGFDRSLGEVLLESHRNYTRQVFALLDGGIEIKGMAHITGGGLSENIPRMLPRECGVEIERGSWPVLPIFTLMQQVGEIEGSEMYRTFNMGVGMVLVVSQEAAPQVSKIVGEYVYEIGRVVEGEKEVRFI